jgi:amino acid adenylation domain-containing protein
MRSKDSAKSLTFAASEYGKEKEYWLDKLSGNLVKSSFPCDTDKAESDGREMRAGDVYETESIRFGGEFLAALMKIGKKSDYMMHMILTAGLAALLGKYTGNSDIITGIPIYRQDKEGEFLNTALVLRTPLEEYINFKELLLQVRQAVIEANEHQNYPLETLLYQLGMTYTGGDFPLFDVVILLENIHERKYILHTHPNILFSFSKPDDTIVGRLEYNPRRYRKETIEQIVRHYVHLLEEVIFHLDTPLPDIDILSGDEKERLLVEFNATRREYPSFKTIGELFREQVTRCPHHAAVVCEDVLLTYRMLDDRSNRLAYYLYCRGVKRENIVGIASDNLPSTVIGILAILKAGGAYLPLNPDYPEERKKYLLGDGNAKVLLGTGDTMFPGVETIDLCDPRIYRDHRNLPGRPPSYKGAAYIIYTSGSSGSPRGVIVEHRSVVRLVKNTNYVEFREKDRILQTGAVDFDASTFEIWGALLNGLTLYLVDKETVLTPDSLETTVRKNGITIMWMTSPLFNRMMDENIEIFRGVRTLLVGGDVLSPAHINRVRNKFPGLKVINGYGPTENTTFSVTHLIEQEYKQRIPIGKPIANSTAYILDKYGNLLPIGAPGELHVGGDGLARGYLNNPELTSEKFPRPYKSYKSCKTNILYRTGDLARWLPDGNIEFLGRADFQVKIRGFRVEPGEIENRLTELEIIHEAVVVVKETNNEKYLCAYVVSAAGKEIDTVELRSTLLEKLPDYMVPAYFVQIEKIPLTPNGKCDRRALPEPEMKAGANYVAPRDESERKLVEIWASVLGVAAEHISVDDDFFELGGHSLKATILLARIYKEFHIKVPLKEIFSLPTVRGLAGYIKKVGIGTYISIEPAEEKEYYAASSPQKRLYFLQQINEGNTEYNIPGVIIAEGEIDGNRMEDTFKKLIRRHESFRTSFKLVNNELVQQVHKEVDFKVDYYKSTHSLPDIEMLAQNFIRPIDLSKAPLFRAAVVSLEDSNYVLLVNIHHIISDGLSQEILAKDFMILQEGGELPPLRLQYKDFAEWQNCQKQSEALAKQESYWLKQFPRKLPTSSLPIDFPRTPGYSSEGSSVEFTLDKEETGKLKALATGEDVSLYMLLFAGVSILLAKISGDEDIVIGCPIAGRRHPDLLEIIGMFVNTLAIRSHPEGHKTYKELLKEVKETTLDAFDNQDYQFEDLVSALKVDRDMRRNPVFDVLFASQNFGGVKMETLPGRTSPLKYVGHSYEYGNAKFDMMILYMDTRDRLSFHFSYRTKLYKKETIEKFASYLKEILSIIVEEPDILISDIELISKEKRRELIEKIRENKEESSEEIQFQPSILRADFDY